MPASTYLVSVPVTPEYVLAVFRDQHRQLVRFDDGCDREVDLTLDSTIEDWRNAMDLVETRPLGRAMNDSWEIQLSDRQWHEVLHPARHRTLLGVAELIARHASRAELRPLAIAGTECLPAAAFLAIRDCLAADGADTSDVAPSTLLSDYARRHLGTFLNRISRLAPGALPDVKVRFPEDPLDLLFGCGALLFWVAGILGKICESPVAYCMPIAAFLQLLHWTNARLGERPLLNSVTFGELRTFRDLAKCVAAGAR
jgi:hypothetical protein